MSLSLLRNKIIVLIPFIHQFVRGSLDDHSNSYASRNYLFIQTNYPNMQFSKVKVTTDRQTDIRTISFLTCNCILYAYLIAACLYITYLASDNWGALQIIGEPYLKITATRTEYTCSLKSYNRQIKLTGIYVYENVFPGRYIQIELYALF